jgi:hypothetical protein
MYNLSEVIDLATLEVLKLPFAQKTASFTLSGAMAAERAERSAATVGGIDGMAEYLNELAARKQSAQFRKETGFKVSEEQLPYWAGLSLWFEGRTLGLDGMPVGTASQMDFRVGLDAAELANESPKRMAERQKQFGKKVDLMRSAVKRCDSYGESEQLPDRWVSMAVGWAEDRSVWLESATYKPSKDLDNDIRFINAWIAEVEKLGLAQN